MEYLTLKEDLSEKELLLIQDEIDYKRMDEILEYLYKNRPNEFNITVDAFIEMNANSDVSLSSVVASFIKFAENNINNWQIPAWTYKDAYLHKAFPCNYKN